MASGGLMAQPRQEGSGFLITSRFWKQDREKEPVSAQNNTIKTPFENSNPKNDFNKRDSKMFPKIARLDGSMVTHKNWIG